MPWLPILITTSSLYFLSLNVLNTESSRCTEGADIVFALDASEQVKLSYDFEKTFVKKLMKKIAKERNQLRAAVVFYSKKAFVKLKFSSELFTLAKFNSAIDQLPYLGGFASTHSAEKFAVVHVFREAFEGPRSPLPKVLFVFYYSGLSFASFGSYATSYLLGLDRKVVTVHYHMPKGVEVDPDQQLRFLENALTAIDKPSIKVTGKTSVFVGGKHRLDCVTSFSDFYSPETDVKWLMNGIEIKHGEINNTLTVVEQKKKIYLDNFVKNLSLIIGADIPHTGNFTCKVSNQFGTRECNIQFSVSCPPALPILSTLPPSIKQESNENVTVSCEANRLDYNQINSYKWVWAASKRDSNGSFNTSVVQVNEKYKILNKHFSPDPCNQFKSSSVLQISNFSSQGLVRYLCMLYPFVWDTMPKVVILPVGRSKALPPPKIVSLNFETCGSTLRLRWDRYLGGGNLTGFQVKLMSLVDGLYEAADVSSATLEYRFETLIPNSDYVVQLRAITSVGYSPWTGNQIKTNAGEPYLSGVKATPYGCSAKLSWEKPEVAICPVTSVVVFHREARGKYRLWQKPTILSDRMINQFRLPLNCSKKYEVLLLGRNEYGIASAYRGNPIYVATEKGVPFKPLLTDKKQWCDKLKVFWEPSNDDSLGGPITGFQVQISGRDDVWRNCTTIVSNHSCLFKGLQSETKYTIRVRAFNRKGPSVWRTHSMKTGLVGPPDLPVILNKTSEISGRNVTVAWERPRDRNCNITMYSLIYKIVNPTDEKCVQINISNISVTRYELHLQYNKKYKVTVFAWNTLGRSQESEALDISTKQYVPYEPIMHSAFDGGCSSISVSWDPPVREAYGGPVIGFLAQIKEVSISGEQWVNCSTVNNSCLFTNLKPNANYNVRVMAKNRYGHGWPSEILSASTDQTDRPNKPVIKYIASKKCIVTIQWTKPLSNGCPILFYTIRYKQQRASDIEWKEVNVTDPNDYQIERTLECGKTYEFEVVAWNLIGGSQPSTVRSITTTTEGFSLASLLSIIFSIGLAVCLVLAIGFKCYNKAGHKRTAKDIQVLDHCEIPPSRTEWIEDLGQGAFGRVRKAKLKDGLGYFDLVQTTRRQKIVAIKELYENTNEEEERRFLDEIELMKTVGKHQNVLSFLGCWTTTKPFLLIIEYVAHGDLLRWLRRKRSQISSSTLSNAEANAEDKELYAGTKTQRATADQGNEAGKQKTDELGECLGRSTAQIELVQHEQAVPDDNTKCTIPMIVFSTPNDEKLEPTESTGDECDFDCESFIPSDLMLFAWQIARGMSYLSEKGLVHRDLAARNILVGHGKTLKIADFGLMRELYHEVYEVNRQKKLPIKWMAPESLYEQIFTSKSDVWSFGVVMWEIGTLGGSPYPQLNNTVLMKLLKTGYRMEKPELCSDNFYSLMMECWKQNPVERPSFQELVKHMEQQMLQEMEYLDFDLLDESKDYYQAPESKTEESDDEEVSQQSATPSDNFFL